MADVQLEHGHVRIANRLAEAMLDAEFSGSQFKMLHGLIRLTYGWRRRTVTLSHAELAAYLHTTPSGTFRAALRELVTEGVVLQLEQGVGHKKSTLAIQKDFTRWGKFSVAPERLERMFGGRPESADELLDTSAPPPPPASETGDEPGAPPVVPDPTPAESVPVEPPAQNRAYGLPENGQAARPEVGTVAGSKWLPPQGMPQRKDRDRQGNTDDSDFGAPREQELRERLPEAADEIALFLSQFDGVRRIAWVGRLHDLLDRTPHFTPHEVREGLAAFMMRLDKSEQGPVALRAFCQRVRDDAARPPEESARASDRPRAAARGGNAGEAEAGRAFAAIRRLITVRPVTGQAPVRYIAKTEVEKLGKVALDAYEQIGGAERFLDQNEQIGFLLRDFTAAYRNALQEGAA